VYDVGEILICHAGLSYPQLCDNTEEDLLWGREWIAYDRLPREKRWHSATRRCGHSYPIRPAPAISASTAAACTAEASALSSSRRMGAAPSYPSGNLKRTVRRNLRIEKKNRES